VLISNSVLLSQIQTQLESQQLVPGTGSKIQPQIINQVYSKEGYLLEEPVNPDIYIIGPGDILSVNVWSSSPIIFLVQVTMEGTTIIPSVGELKISGLSLLEAKKLIMQKVQSKYTSDVSTTLIFQRVFLVTVTGYVLKEGKFITRAGNRISNIVDDQIRQKPSIADSISFRKIQLRRGKKTLNIDLVKYLATGEDKYNPFVLEGDWIFIPRRDFNSFVSIYGAVNRPGSYEFIDGDSLNNIVTIAGGIFESGDVENIEISRLDENGALKETIKVNLKKILRGEAKDIKLERNDRILVPEKRSLKRDYKVYVSGEINHPGFYPISRNGTKLSEILQKIGINKYSELEGAVILRNSSGYFDFGQIKTVYPVLLLKNFGLTSEDLPSFNQEIQALPSNQLVSVNISDVLNNKTDYELQDKDFIYIPQKNNSVYVFGQVNNPGFIPYEQNKNYKYYISRAGGFSDLAQTGNVKVIKRKTYIWHNAGDIEIETGDFVFVPKRIVREPLYYVNVTSTIVSSVGAVASAVTAIVSLYLLFKQLGTI
jgi:protein involved in polysaccharide export with SLBB domain